MPNSVLVVLVVDHSALLMMGVAGKTKFTVSVVTALVMPLPSDTLTGTVPVVLAAVCADLDRPALISALDAIDEDQRRVHISAGTERGQQWLQAWPHAGASDHAP